MRSTPRRSRLPSTLRRIRSGARPRSAGSPVTGLKTFVVTSSPSGRRSARQRPMYDSLRPPPYASAVSNQRKPAAHAASMIARASSSFWPLPKNAGADPMPPKLPHPSARRGQLIAGGGSLLRLRQGRELVAELPQVPEVPQMDQPPEHLDRRALRPDHRAADHTLDDHEVTRPPRDDPLVPLDQALGELVQRL